MPLISMTFSMKLMRLGEQLFSGSLHPSMISFRVVSSLQMCIPHKCLQLWQACKQRTDAAGAEGLSGCACTSAAWDCQKVAQCNAQGFLY